MMTPGMNKEFTEIFEPTRRTEGTIPAKRYALGVMLQARRERLASLLTSATLDNDPESTWNPATEIAMLNAELTLLMIERGA